MLKVKCAELDFPDDHLLAFFNYLDYNKHKIINLKEF